MEKLSSNFALQMNQIYQTIDECIEARRYLPAYILLFSAIDALAWLDREGDEATRRDFIRWVDRHMLADVSEYRGIDLYAARCSMLHSFSPFSSLSRKGEARPIVYAYGNRTAIELATVLKGIGRDECIALHINDLIRAFRDGVDRFVGDTLSDSDRLAQTRLRLKGWMTQLDL